MFSKIGSFGASIFVVEFQQFHCQDCIK